MSSELRTLQELADEVAKQSRAITDYLSSNSFYQPSFQLGGFKEYPDLPFEIEDSRRKLSEAAKAVFDLANGPKLHVQVSAWQYSDPATLRFLLHFRIPPAIPLVGSITYAQLATVTDVEEMYLRRYLRQAMTNRMFYEPSPDEVAHTPFSAPLVTDALTVDMIQTQLEDFYPNSATMAEAYEKYGPTEETNELAHNVRNRTDLGYFPWVSQPGNEQKRTQFAGLMRSVHVLPAYKIEFTVQGYDWASLKGGTIVDVGGSEGGTAIALRRAHPDLPPIIVQDLPHTVAAGEAALPPEMKDNGSITFQAQDFFEPQPASTLSTASVFLLRQILHDHSDKYCRRILRNLLPALKGETSDEISSNGVVGKAKLVVLDAIAAPPGMAPYPVEKMQRALDLDMMSTFGGREKQKDEWDELFRSVDPKLAITNVNQQMGSALAVMEVMIVD